MSRRKKPAVLLELLAACCTATAVAQAKPPAMMRTYSVNLAWQEGAGAGPTAGYNVYRERHGDALFVQINCAEVTATRYRETLVSNGTAYQFYVIALDSMGNESGPSNTITLSIPWVPYPLTFSAAGRHEETGFCFVCGDELCAPPI